MRSTTLAPDLLDDVVDLATFPIDRIESAQGRALVTQCRKQLGETGCVVLRNFIGETALKRLESETTRLSPRAHMNETETNPYNTAGNPALPSEHPTNRFADRTNGFVAGDCIAEDTILRRVYRNSDFKAFVAAIVGRDQVHEFADPLADLVVNVLSEGRQHPWHFDSNDFIVTMLTSQPQGGGLFEYAPCIRNADHENVAGVQKILDGDRSDLVSIALQPGDLQVFFGRNSLHRVSPVEGTRERHTVIFAYAEYPGFIGDP